MAQTRYYRSDQHTVNGLTAYKLGISNSNSMSFWGDRVMWNTGEPPEGTAYYKSDVYIRHADGSETMVGSGVAQTSRTEPASAGYQSATWSCPEVTLNTSDAIKVVDKNYMPHEEHWYTRSFVTEQLGASKIKASVWTFTRFTYWDFGEQEDGQWQEVMTFHGDSSHATRIEGIELEFYLDIGLRVKTSSGVVKIGVQELQAGHKLRVRKGDVTYGIPLVDVTDSSVSPIRIYDGSSVKALPEIS